MQHMLETAVIVGASLAVGLLVDDVSVVFGFVGAVGSATLSLTLPALAAIASKRYRPKRTRFTLVTSWLVVVYGVVLTVMGMVTTTQKALEE